MSYYNALRLANTGYNLYSKFRRNNRRRPNRRTSAYARTYRRYGNKRRRGYTNYQSNSGIKKVNNTRKQIGLPNLELKRHLIYYSGAQWSTLSSSDWSSIIPLSTIAIGSTNETRESNKIKILPIKRFTIRLNQAVNQEYEYRILLIKKLTKSTLAPYPTDVFADWVAWKFSSYKLKDKKTSTDPKFIILKDINFRWNSDSGKGGSTLKKINFKIPTSNITYDPDPTTGTFNENSLHIAIATNAPSASTSYSYDIFEYIKFLDQ